MVMGADPLDPHRDIHLINYMADLRPPLDDLDIIVNRDGEKAVLEKVPEYMSGEGRRRWVQDGTVLRLNRQRSLWLQYGDLQLDPDHEEQLPVVKVQRLFIKYPTAMQEDASTVMTSSEASMTRYTRSHRSGLL